MKNSILRQCERLSAYVAQGVRITRAVIPSCTALLLVGGLASCSDDLLTGTPDSLGESIYGELESRGNFTQTLKLINSQDDDDYATMLRRTGSKTLFVADDAAWAKFFQNNPWGVKSIDEMSTAQKRLLFKSSMINSAYLLELLGNMQSSSASDDPVEGSCMRRETGISYLDSLPLVSTYPDYNPARVDSVGNVLDYWSKIRTREHIYLLQDNSSTPMIHLMPKFMKNNNITDADVAFLTNGKVTSNNFAFVNGEMVREDDLANNVLWQDIVCQNGYIHVLDGVPMQLDNLANVVAKNPQFSIYNRLLERFSYPQYLGIFENSVAGKDSVFVKRFFSSHSLHGLQHTDEGTPVSNLLPYDPGWNRYTLNSASGASYQIDAAVMLVPTDDAMKDYLQHDGKDLNDLYATAGPGETAWDNAPDEVVLPLLENTMLPSLKAAIPSQLASISNSAGETMGVKKEDIDQVLWACNGIVYQSNKVFVAPEYVSVYYPIILRANRDLSTIYTVINNDRQVTGGEGFRAYLTSMGSKYSFIIPTNSALQTYYDPVSRFRRNNGKSTAIAYKFFVNDGGSIAAYAYDVDWNTLDEKGRGTISSDLSTTSSITAQAVFNKSSRDTYDAFNHMKDIINSSLATTTFKPNQKFYLAKNGSPIIVEWSGNTVTGIAGSFQYERGYFIPVTEIVDKTLAGNGTSYVVEDEPLMSTFVSPYAAINDATRADRFSNFANMLGNSSLLLNGVDASGLHATADYALKNLDNYHYTIFVPTNESIQALMDAHKLPTSADITAVTNCLNSIDPNKSDDDANNYKYLTEQLQIMNDVVNNFVNYHIQDNSVFIDGEAYNDKLFETACLDTISKRFVKVRTSYDQSTRVMTVKDAMGNVRTVDAACNNIMTRQYYFSANTDETYGNKDGKAPKLENHAKKQEATQIYSSAFAVIHQIDEPLQSSATCYYDPAEYANVQAVMAQYSTSKPFKKSKR